MTDIQLNFINKSNGMNNINVVIFQKNQAQEFDEIAIAWKVIQNCGQGDNHPFVFPLNLEIAASDSYGNYTLKIPATYGQRFHVYESPSGTELAYKDDTTSPKEIQLLNSLSKGSIDALIFKSGKLLAKKTNVVPGEQAVFSFKPIIYIGVVSDLVEGEQMSSAIINSINTQISLLGIASADIIMTGGGTGSSATEYKFTLENVVMT